MSKIIIGTLFAACALVCIGYYIHRKNKGQNSGTDVLDLLKLQDIFKWIDEVFLRIGKESGVKYEINILPNGDTQKLIKKKDRRAYAVILKKEETGEKKVVLTKVFFANAIDVDLDALNDNQIVVIPVE